MTPFANPLYDKVVMGVTEFGLDWSLIISHQCRQQVRRIWLHFSMLESRFRLRAAPQAVGGLTGPWGLGALQKEEVVSQKSYNQHPCNWRVVEDRLNQIWGVLSALLCLCMNMGGFQQGPAWIVTLLCFFVV